MRSGKAFDSEAAIAAIGSGFIDLTLPKSAWTHAAHFAATLWLLSCRKDLDLARDMPQLIRSYNEATGTANSDTGGYHETITQASIRAARAFLAADSSGSLLRTCNALLSSPYGAPDWLLTYWSRPCLYSVAARRAWIDPDIRPLPF